MDNPVLRLFDVLVYDAHFYLIYLSVLVLKVSKCAKIIPSTTPDPGYQWESDKKARINRRAQRHGNHKTEKHKRSTKEVPSWNGQ